MKENNRSFPAYLRGPFTKDLMASVVVFLVALPLCMGIAIASGVPPAYGIITGIIGGLVVGTLAGSPLQVSGPAAGLTVLIWQFVQAHGVAMLGAAVVIAGLIQILAGLLKFGQWFRAISPAVIQGMLAGIGILIIGSQTHVLVDDGPKGSGLQNLLTIPSAIWKGLMPIQGDTHHLAAYIGMLTIVIMVAWKFVPQRLKIVPAPLLAVVVATGVAAFFKLPIYYVSVSGSFLSDIAGPSLETWGSGWNLSILLGGVAIALVASAETLFCATAVDQMHQGARTNYDRELFAQGVGNTLCGLLGSIPMTGVIVRSTANIEAGGCTRGSAILHGIWLLAAVSLLPWLLNLIPTTSLAAILVFTGFKLVSPEAIRLLRQYGKSEVAIYAATVIAIVTTDLLKGVLFGLALSLGKLIYTFSHLEVKMISNQPIEGKTTMELRGAATFVRLPKLAAALESVPGSMHLHIVLDQLDYIDHACIDLLSNWGKQHEAGGGRIIMEWDKLHRKYFDPSASAASRSATVPLAWQKKGKDQMINIKTILAPTDFSTPAQYALECAGDLAKNLNAKMYVLHVAEYSNVGGDPDASELLIPNHIPELEKKGKGRLGQITLRLRQAGVDAHSVFVAGRAYQDIVKMANELKVDLLVLGTHGHTGFSHLFFGSTAEKVVRLCPCPVLTVKHPDYALDKASYSNDATA